MAPCSPQALPEPMLQDVSRDLSAVLATAPHARQHAIEASAAIEVAAVDLLGDPVGELADECDPDLAQCRDALAQALEMLDELICAHAPKRAAAALFARVSALRDLGGLPRVTPTTAT